MALSFIGKPISLISHSDVRYRGILAGIDPQASTIQLSNVYSMGTESRRPPQQYIAPVQDPYAYIIFRASEVKDLSVDEVPTQQQHNVHDDPAVLGAGGPATKSYPAQPATQQPANGAPPSQGGFVQQPTQATLPTETQQQTALSQPATGTTPTRPQQQNGNNNNRRPNPVHTAAASLETVERALGDLRVSNNTPGQPNGGSARGGRRGGGQGNRGGRHGGTESELKVPKTDFDFASSNAKFDKATISPAVKSTSEDAVAEGAEGGKPAEDAPHPAYNPQRSFFDSLSSSSNAPAPNPSGGNSRGGRRGGGPGGAGGRNRREEEREKNVATFGEPGGVGLLGPGGYVGGWGGYGRRGGRRGGSRGGRGGGSGGNAPAVQARG